VELIAGGGGIFDVSADGRPVFSKHKSGRFPEPGEIVRLLAGHG
jgi:selT/selW/selH-like putative selenoprotein